MHFIKKKIYWIALALAIKMSFSIVFINIHPKQHSINGFYGCFGGDSISYIQPIENLIKYGYYSYYYSNQINYAFRMPGYGIIYFLLRIFLEQASALNILVLLQILLSAFSIYYLALLSFSIFKKSEIFYIVFFLYAFSTFVSIFDTAILTESFSAAGLIFSIYFFIKGLQKEDKKLFFFSGLFLTWVIFMKPYLVLLPAVLAIILFWFFTIRHSSQIFKKGIVTLVVFLFPFIVCNSLWILRNYKIYKQIVPLVYIDHSKKSVTDKVLSFTGKNSPSRATLYRFIQITGGDDTVWNPRSEACWVENYGNKGSNYWRPVYKLPQNNPFPEFIFTSKYNFSSLIEMRKMYLTAHDINLPLAEREKYENKVTQTLEEYITSFKEEHPFHYYITAYLRSISGFLFHSGTYNLLPVVFAKMNILEKAFKLAYTLLYLFVIVFGFLGIILILLKKIDIFRITLCVMPLYFIIIFPIILRLRVYRYFVPAYPFMLVLSSYVVMELILPYWRRFQGKILKNI